MLVIEYTSRYCEKLKMTHETQLDLGNIKSGTEQIHGEDMRNGYGDKMRNGYKDKMRHFNEFFASFLRFCVFHLSFFVMDATS